MAKFNEYTALTGATTATNDVLGIWDTSAVEFKNITASELQVYYEANMSYVWGQITGVPSASDTASGVIELATQVEADAGTDALRAITPATLSNYPFPGGSGATESEITQTTHGFAVMDAVRFNGTSWVKAQANASTTTALGIVVAVADVNTFTFAMSGRYQIGALTADSWYYLDSVTAGSLTVTEPTISQPIIYAEDGSWVVIYPYRPSATGTGDTLDSVTGRGATTTNAITVGGFTSTGIDDNATSVALTIDSSQIVAGTWSSYTTANTSAKMMKLTQAQYDGLTPDANTMYFIVG